MLALAGCPQPPAIPAPGTLDDAFGTAGKTLTDVTGTDDEVYGLALQSNGRILAAGFGLHGSSKYDLAVARYLAGGSLDTSYGTGGKYILDIGSADDFSRAIVVQVDGMSVVAGRTGFDALLVRLDADGVPDPLFDADGMVISDFGGNEGWLGLALQDDGKLVAAGWAGPVGNSDFAVARFNTDGSPDTDFGTGGLVTLDILGYNDLAYAVAIQSDDMIVVAGYGSDPDGNKEDVVARFDADGNLDSAGFGTGGVMEWDIGATSDDRARALLLQTDGKIVIAGETTVAGPGTDMLTGFVARFTSAGAPDATFTGVVHALVMQPGGRILAVGKDEKSSPEAFGLYRFTTTGTLDAGFGSSGRSDTTFGSDDAEAHAVVLTPQGRLVVGGNVNAADGDFALARYW